jgi:glycolate oxidase
MKEHFEKILGPANASENPNDLEAYSYDASELPGKARMVLFPSSDEEVRAIFSYCNRSNLDIILRGNATSSTGGATPNNSIVVSTQNLNKIRAINVREQWVHVDCGATIQELNDALKPHGLLYPLTTGAHKLTTVGGLLSVNGWNKYSFRYGRPLDTALELEIMDGTGKLFTLKQDAKECAGFEGTCVCVVRAKLRVTPIVDRTADVKYFDTLPEALEYATDSLEKKPLSVDFVDSIGATYAGMNTKHAVIVEYDSDEGSHKYENYAALMHKREHVRRAVGQQGYVLREDARVDDTLLLEALDWCIRHELPVVAHVAVGVVHPYMKREQEQLRDAWCAYVTEHGGMAAGEYGWGVRKKKYVPQQLKVKLRQFKERYDYNNILGRGKVGDYV